MMLACFAGIVLWDLKPPQAFGGFRGEKHGFNSIGRAMLVEPWASGTDVLEPRQRSQRVGAG
jgi:hypothetical protein